MGTFIDPRNNSRPEGRNVAARTTTDTRDLEELYRLCREGRLYDTELWIGNGRPLQIAPGTPVSRSRTRSALDIALETGNHALTLLLLANGYDPNTERRSPLDRALRARRTDLVHLLLEWGADPQSVDLGTLFNSYQSVLFERFQDLGVDLTRNHALAEALAEHTSNRPLFGFAKRHRQASPNIQAELNIALGYHVSERNEKGIQLCLWAGADSHARAFDLRYGCGSGSDSEEGELESLGVSAVFKACLYGNVHILKRLKPDPGLDDFDQLYEMAHDRTVLDFLAQLRPPKDAGALIRHQVWWAAFNPGRWKSIDAVRWLFEIGVRWTHSSREEAATIRWCLLKTSDTMFVDLMKLLATDDYCSPQVLKDLARTPAMHARMKRVGFLPPPGNEPRRRDQLQPTRSREVLKKFGIELKPPRGALPPPLARVLRVGPWHRDGREVRYTRQELFERVWSEPVMKIAAGWGLSGTGLKKVCRRLRVPVPPRGYWARLKAGHIGRRPKLPALPEGEGEEIVFRTPD